MLIYPSSNYLDTYDSSDHLRLSFGLCHKHYGHHEVGWDSKQLHYLGWLATGIVKMLVQRSIGDCEKLVEDHVDSLTSTRFWGTVELIARRFRMLLDLSAC